MKVRELIGRLLEKASLEQEVEFYVGDEEISYSDFRVADEDLEILPENPNGVVCVIS